MGLFVATPTVVGTRSADNTDAVTELPPARLIVVADDGPYGVLLGQQWLTRAAAVLDSQRRIVTFVKPFAWHGGNMLDPVVQTTRRTPHSPLAGDTDAEEACAELDDVDTVLRDRDISGAELG